MEHYKNYKWWLIIVLLLTPLFIFSQNNEDKLQFNGFVDTYHAVRTAKPNDFMSSRTRFRGELQKAFGKSAMFVSFNLNQNSMLKELNGFELREAYLDYTAQNWSLRAGRQLIIWGAADGMRITDLLSPMDMTEFLARDYDDIRMPVEALKFKYFNDILKLEFVYIPIFKPFVLPTNPKNPWAISLPAVPNMKTTVLPENRPQLSLKNGELAGRLAFSLPGIDFSISALHTWDKMPLTKTMLKAPDTLVFMQEYNRLNVLGIDVSKPLGQFVLRGEAAFNFDKQFAHQKPNMPNQKHHTANYLLGIDWFAPDEWMLSAQFSSESIFKHSKTISNDKNSYLATFNISKKLLNSNLQLSDFIYIDLLNGGFFNRFSADYSLTDQIRFVVGYDHFQGDEGMFSYYKNNSEVWIKAKYSF